MARKESKVVVGGRTISASKYADAVAFNRGAAKYIKARREARKRARQIKERSGPASMEWVQSALFMYAAKKNGFKRDLRKALWAYTSAMVIKLEDFITNYEYIASKHNVDDAYHWTALQLRAAIRNHMKLLDMFKDEVIELPEITTEGCKVRSITHYPKDREVKEAMDFMITDYRMNNPDAADIMPKPDEDLL